MKPSLIYTIFFSTIIVGCSVSDVGQRLQQAGAAGSNPYAYWAKQEENKSENSDEIKCISWGAKKGTSEYLNCRLQLETHRKSSQKSFTCYQNGKNTICN